MAASKQEAQWVLRAQCDDRRNLASLHTPELFRPWIYRIASREAFRHLKKQKRRPDREPEKLVPLEELAISPVAPSTELLESLLDADTVTPASRAVRALHFEQELPFPEVAAVLEIPLGTVKSRLAAGLAALRKEFTEKGNFNARRS